jgi:hypothetical protein
MFLHGTHSRYSQPLFGCLSDPSYVSPTAFDLRPTANTHRTVSGLRAIRNWNQGMVNCLTCQASARQGRGVDRLPHGILDGLDKVVREVGGHPVRDRGRGDGYSHDGRGCAQVVYIRKDGRTVG